jgi:hypothetical protein
MKALLAIAEREIRDRWLLFAGAALVGILPWALHASDKADTFLAAWILAMLFGMATAILTGWSVIGRDLTEDRLAFFFSRPIPWWAIWGGKWLAGAVLILSSAFLMWLMVVPLEPDAAAKMPGWFFEGSVALAGTWCLLLMAVSHVASVAFRSRSLLLAVDLVLLPVSVFLFLWLGAPLILSGYAFGGIGWPVAGRVTILASVFTLAGAAQVAVGRIDKRRGHRAMSTVLWSGITILLVIVGLGSYRLTHFGLEELSDVFSVTAAPQGSWVELTGSTKGHGRSASFLVDAASGRSRARSAFPSPSEAAFSADGTRAVWLEASGPGAAFAFLRRWPSWNQLVVARLDGPSPSTTRRALGLPVENAWSGDLALSPDGARVAVLGGEMLDVFDVASGKHLTGIPSAEGRWSGPLRFTSSSRVQAYRQHRTGIPRSARTMQLVEVDSNSRSSATTLGSLSLREGEVVTQSCDDGRLLVRTWPFGPGGAIRAGALNRVEVHAMPSDRVVTSIALQAQLRDAFLLEDGRVALLHDDGSQALRLDLHSPEGALLWSLAFPLGQVGGSIGGLLSPDRLTVTIGLPLLPKSTAVVSLSTGAIVHSYAEMSVIGRRWWSNPLTPGPLAARLLKTKDGGLVLLDPEGKTTRTILRPLKDR